MSQSNQSKLLSAIDCPDDLKKCSVGNLSELAKEIRSLLITTIAKNGGHLASNLGVVELTLALHYVFNSPKDEMIWDVGHQAYTHKLLTGRRKAFASIRQFKGLSGYLKRAESAHDIYGGGHVGTAVSAALGFAHARDLLKQKHSVIAVIGDGSMTNGLTFEGLNNIGNSSIDITVVLNDNKFSISKNIGGIAKYLEKLSTININGDDTDVESIFNALGFTYFGPIDGHNILKLIEVFEKSKTVKGPKLIHITTKKGMGYLYSENNPSGFHFTSPFILESGKVARDVKNLTYSKAFGQTLVKIAKKNKKVIAITAAMPAGTGVDLFAQTFPARYFDTGIAEEHAVVFAAGLAIKGFRPVVAIYSTFLQRAYDQILHDVALQKIPVVFAVDRAGLVGSDGPTHHGAFDLSYLRSIPNLILLAPKDQNELRHMLYSVLRYKRGPVAIRYPRGGGNNVKIDRKLKYIPVLKAEMLDSGTDGAIIAIGSTVEAAHQAAAMLAKQKIQVSVYNARSVKPLDRKMIADAAKTGIILTVEENILDGGFGSAILEELEKEGLFDVCVKRLGLHDFVEHGDAEILRKQNGLIPENIKREFIKLIKSRKVLK